MRSLLFTEEGEIGEMGAGDAILLTKPIIKTPHSHICRRRAALVLYRGFRLGRGLRGCLLIGRWSAPRGRSVSYPARRC